MDSKSPDSKTAQTDCGQINPVRWVEIYVQDMPRAKKFYEAVLGFTLTKLDTPEHDLWAFPMSANVGGAGGALVKMDGVPSGGNSTICYFGSADCAVESNKVVAAGGRIHKAKFSIGQYGFIALSYDTEGNIFGVHSTE